MMRVHGDTISAGRRFRGNQLLLLLHPAAHFGVGRLGPPPSEGLRGPLRRPGAPGAVGAVGAVCAAVWLMHSLSMLCCIT